MRGNLADADGVADAGTSGFEGSGLSDVLHLVDLKGASVCPLDGKRRYATIFVEVDGDRYVGLPSSGCGVV